MTLKRLALLSVASLALLGAPGCGTIANHTIDERKPFGGVRDDALVMALPFTELHEAEDLALTPLCLIGGLADLPFSIVGDLVMLPADLARRVR